MSKILDSNHLHSSGGSTTVCQPREVFMTQQSMAGCRGGNNNNILHQIIFNVSSNNFQCFIFCQAGVDVLYFVPECWQVQAGAALQSSSQRWRVLDEEYQELWDWKMLLQCHQRRSSYQDPENHLLWGIVNFVKKLLHRYEVALKFQTAQM